MGVQNLQFFMPNSTQTADFVKSGNVSGSRQQQKSNNFSATLNSAVERGGLNAAKDLEQNQALEDDSDVVAQKEEQAQDEVNAQAGDAEEKVLAEGNPGNSQTKGEEENTAGDNTVPVEAPAAAANLLALLESLQAQPQGQPLVSTEAQSNAQTTPANILTEQAALYLAADKSKNLLSEQKIVEPKPGETMLAGNTTANAAEETNPQNLIPAKTPKGQQLPQTIFSKVIPHNVVIPDETVQNAEGKILAAGKAEQSQPSQAAQLEMTQQIKGITEQLKGIAEQLQAQAQTTAKPAVDLSGVKPVVVEPVKLNEQPVPGEAVNLKAAGEAETENLANQKQNTGGQFSMFDQKASAQTMQPQNSDQMANNNQTFAVPVDVAAQNPANRMPNVADAAAKAAPDFTAMRDDYQIKNQIVEQAALVNRSAQESEMIIRLKPQHLGELALKVTVNSGVVNATFHTNNAEVRGVLENSLHQLKQDLANVGFKVDNVSISAGLSQFTASQEHTMQWQQQQTQNLSGAKGGESYEEALESIPSNQAVTNSSTDDGVDYRI